VQRPPVQDLRHRQREILQVSPCMCVVACVVGAQHWFQGFSIIIRQNCPVSSHGSVW